MNTTSSTNWCITAASITVIFAGLIAAQTIVTPILLAAFFSILISPIQHWLVRLRIPAPLAVVITLVSVIILFTIVVNILTVSITGLISDLPTLTKNFQDRMQEFVSYLPIDDLSSKLKEMVQPQTVVGIVQSSMRDVLAVFNDIFLIVFLILFMLLESTQMKKKLAEGSVDTLNSFVQFSKKIGSYMFYKGVFSVITGVCVYLGLWLLSVDYAALWGFLAFLLNFIPTVGSIIAAIPAVLIALVGSGLVDAGLVALLFIVVNVVVGNFIEPKYMGQGMGLSSLVVFISLLFWGWAFGIVGMFLSVPLTMVIKIAMETRGHNKVASLLEP